MARHPEHGSVADLYYREAAERVQRQLARGEVLVRQAGTLFQIAVTVLGAAVLAGTALDYSILSDPIYAPQLLAAVAMMSGVNALMGVTTLAAGPALDVIRAAGAARSTGRARRRLAAHYLTAAESNRGRLGLLTTLAGVAWGLLFWEVWCVVVMLTTAAGLRP